MAKTDDGPLYNTLCSCVYDWKWEWLAPRFIVWSEGNLVEHQSLCCQIDDGANLVSIMMHDHMEAEEEQIGATRHHHWNAGKIECVEHAWIKPTSKSTAPPRWLNREHSCDKAQSEGWFHGARLNPWGCAVVVDLCLKETRSCDAMTGEWHWSSCNVVCRYEGCRKGYDGWNTWWIWYWWTFGSNYRKGGGNIRKCFV